MSRNQESRSAFGSSALRDLERCVERELDVLGSENVSAFLLEPRRLALAVELRAGLVNLLSPDALVAAIDEAISLHRASAPELVVLLEAGKLPRTVNGRRRRSCARLWREGALDTFAIFRAGARVEAAAPAAEDAPPTATEIVLAEIWRQVLDVDVVERGTSFFAAGGNSISAVQVMARVQEQLGVTLDLAVLFDTPTLAEIAVAIERAASAGETRAPSPIVPVSRAARLPLSPMQARMRLLWQLDPAGGAYNISGTLRLQGELDRAALQSTFDLLVRRHEALRTRFPEHDGEPYQRIDPPAPVTIALEDLEALPEGEREQQARARLSAVALTPFDLERGPLLRVHLFRLSAGEHQLCVTLHHSVADGPSMNVLVAEFATIYAAHVRGEAAALPPLAIQYADYAHWQQQRLASGEAERQLAYFRGKLGAEQPLLELPADRPRPALASQRGARLGLSLDRALVERARAVAREHNKSLFMVLLGAFALLLHRHTGQRDLRVGVPAANRLRREAEPVLGAFVNTQVYRVELDPQRSFLHLLEQVKSTALEAQRNQDLPFERLVEALAPERDSAHHPLFQVMYNHQQRQLAALQELPGLTASVVDVETDVTRFDLSLATEEHDDGSLSALFVYASDLFERERMQRLAHHFVALLDAATRDVSRPVRSLEWLSEDERAGLLAFGTSARWQTRAGLAHEWFVERARARPEAVALTSGESDVSYGELEARTGRLARALAARGAGPDVVVAVAVPRSIELCVALLAVARAGAAFLPIDPEHPRERQEYLLRDSGARLLLTVRSLVSELPHFEPTLLVDEPSDVDLVQTTLVRPGPENLAYVLYTSGTTGLPKAVGNTHAGLAARLSWMQDEYGLETSETLLHKTPATFDVAVWELFWPLAIGARLAIAAPGEHRDPLALARLIQRHGVSTIHFVPSLFAEFVAEAESANCSSLRRLFSGGEALSVELARRIQARFPAARLDNRYGPTEALINAVYWTCGADEAGPLPIGRPIPNTDVRILDANLDPVPVGVIGELYITGAGLARGYLGRPALTAERFLPDPFASEPGQRLYRTGDVARYRADGAIEYHGRRDEQVKIRGVRIELGEVTEALRTLPGVTAAGAVVQGAGSATRLVGFVAGAGELDEGWLRAELERRLPAHLVPSRVVRLERLPTTPNGKLDRRALPVPSVEARASRAPETAAEIRVARIWAEVLGLDHVGLDDDFFALGGHSLLATQVVSRVRRAFGIELMLRELFEARSVGAFAARVQAAIDAGRVSGQPALERAPRGARLPLSYAQERMWFLWRLEPASAAYNVGGSVALEGALNTHALQRAFDALVERHEALRTTFPAAGGQPEQRVHPSLGLPLECVDLRALPTAERELRARSVSESERPFDLETGPLCRLVLLRVRDERHVLLVTLHHIVAEGWAMDVFARECIALYEAFCRGEPSPLEPLPMQYVDYAAWQRRWLDGGEAERQIEYWRRTLGGEHPVLELPADRPRPATQSFRGDYHRLRLDRGLTARLRELCVRRGVTLNMALMAGFFALFHRYTGDRDIRLGYPIANRSRPELEGLIGAFLNTQVLRCEVEPELTLAALLDRVKDGSLEAQAHQDVPFHLVVDALAPKRSAAHTPLFQVMVNVQRWQFQQRRHVSGLELEFIANDARAAQFDLAVDVSDVDAELECAFSYSLDLFDLPTVERLTLHWTRVLEQLVEQPERRICALQLSSADEWREALRAAAGAVVRASGAETVHEAFEVEAAVAAEREAVVGLAGRLTYTNLDARSNQLARELQARGVGPDVVVGLFMERSLDVAIGVLAILKAGGAYLPLDPSYPEERLRHMLDDSGVRLVLSEERLEATIPTGAGRQVFCLDRDAASVTSHSAARLPRRARADNLIYVIYTSGSTGKPKGVANTHRGVLNRLRWMQSEYRLEASDVVLLKAPLSFDVSAGELLWPLISGACLAVAPPGAERDPIELRRAIQRHSVSVIDFVPTLLGALLESGELGSCPTLRLATVGGEALPPELVRRFREQHSAALYNMYGPTEASIDVTFSRCDADGVADGRVPLGHAMANTSVHVLDANLEPVPPGVVGEIYIGGLGLARGYVGRPAATAERFLPNPLGGAEGERLYRTGDLGRRRADGVLEFIGRADQQVKIRGHRIEIGEVESQLRQHPEIADVAVVARRAGPGAQLVAYIVPRAGSMEPAAEQEFWASLRARLGAALPEYMLPARFAVLAALPLTPSGKLDRAALPEPELGESQNYTAPDTDGERALAEIWQEVLGAPRVGLDDNFFELGGDSIVSLQVVHRARQRGLSLAPRQLFQHQTVRALARSLTLAPSATALAVRGATTGDAPLTPVQHRFFAEVQRQRDHYNQALLLRPRAALDPELLARALAVVTAHHDAFRLRFEPAADRVRQYHAEPAPGNAETLWRRQAADTAALARVTDEAQRSLNIERGPLWRAVSIALPGGEQRLLLVVHHLVIDGVSWRVLLEDLELVYSALARGEASPALVSTSSYAAWSATLAAYARSPELAAELGYWCTALPPLPEPPVDHSGGAQDAALRATCETRLDAGSTRRLLREAPEAYRARVSELLIAALARVLCRFSAQPAALVELEGHGRDDRFAGVDVSRTLGWFTTLFPVSLTPVAGSDPGALSRSVRAVKEQLRAVPRQGLGYGVLAELGDDATRARLAALPRPRVTFNYLGQFDASVGDAAWLTWAPESSGQSQGDETPLGNWLSVNASVNQGELHVIWIYSHALYDTSTIERLAREYDAELAALLASSGDADAMSPSDFPLASLSPAVLDRLPLSSREVSDIYALAPLQQGILFHSVYSPDSELYVSQLTVEVRGLDAARLARAFQVAIQRHDVLRTGFVETGEQAPFVQVVQRSAELEMRVIEHRAEPSLSIEDIARRERTARFDLTRPPLMRLAVARLESTDWLIWTYHHVLIDGWSSARLMEEVLRTYAGDSVPVSPMRYRSYIEWLSRRDAAADERFWRSELSRLEEPTRLGGRSAVASGAAQDVVLARRWSAEATQRLSRFAQRERVTFNTLVQAAWVLLLQRYTGLRSVAFGATVSGRPPELEGAASLVGLFINTIPVIAAPVPRERVGAYLRELQASNLRLREHEHAPLSDVQRWAGQGGQALFDTLLVFENYPLDGALRERGGAGLEFGRSLSVDRTNYPLTLEVSVGDEMSLVYKYSPEHFDAERIEAIDRHLGHLLEQLAQDGSRAVGALTLATPAEQHAAFGWSQVPSIAEPFPGVCARVDGHAARAPDAIALVCGQASMTYGALVARANRLAWRLRQLGVGPDVLVGLCLERSLDMVIGLLAILKAGGAYVPLDPHYPADRLEFMIVDSGMSLLISTATLAERLQARIPVWCVDRDAPELERLSSEPVPATELPGHLGYCIYTSGSSGRPKGAMITHDGLRNYLGWAEQVYRVPELDGSAVHSSISFDLTVTSLWLPLCAGKRVELTRDDREPVVALIDSLSRSEGLGLLKITPAHALALAQLLERPLPGIRCVVVGGEALSWECVAALGRIAPGARVINEYGPTETVVGCCVLEADASRDGERSDSVPIGLPIDHTQLFVVDGAFQPVPVGVAGQLCIGGAGLARGYLRRPSLTAERFVPNPFASSPGERLYLTGDLARYRADGVLEYLGRSDSQIKIRGYRIELGEIEARLTEHPRVRDAAVIARDGAGGKQLFAYVVPEDEPASSNAQTSLDLGLSRAEVVSRAERPVAGSSPAGLEAELAAYLRALLPEHMIPARILSLEALPLTQNGKLDRAALPAPDSGASERYVEPETEAERVLARIWGEALRVPRVGRDDDFFALGGDSIVSLQVVSRARRAGFRLSPRDVFAHSTLSQQAAHMASGASAVAAASAPQLTPLVPASELTRPDLGGEPEDAHPLSPLQAGMLFHARLDPSSAVYVSQLSVRVGGLDVERLRGAWTRAVARHTALRTSFRERADGLGPIAVVHRSAPLALVEMALETGGDAEAAIAALARDERSRGFDLERPPLQRVVLARLDAGEHQLIWTFHHALMDGWSSARLIEEVLADYSGESVAPPVGRYRDYIAWTLGRDPAPSERFWVEQLRPLDEPTRLAPRAAAAGTHAEARLVTRLGQQLSSALVRVSRQEKLTLSTLMQGAWALLLSRQTAQASVAFGVAVAGRPESVACVDSVLGLFINTLPVVQTPKPSLALRAWLRQLQEQSLSLREHEHCALHDVQRWAGRPGEALFDTLVVFDNYPVDEALRARSTRGLRFGRPETSGSTHYPLSVEIALGDDVAVDYCYLTSSFEPGEIEALRGRYEALLRQLARGLEGSVGSLSISAPAEVEQLEVWNDTAAELGIETTLHAIVEAQVARTPDAIALVAGDASLSYRELNARANQLAHYLISVGVSPDSLVGVCVERSLELGVGLLAILKAGAAYVPLDPEYPEERLAYMLKDSGVQLLLSQSHLRPRLPASDARIFCLDSEFAECARFSRETPARIVSPQQLAYCIYTSGSTGQPKAAGNPHRAIVNRLRWMQAQYPIDASDRVLQKTPFSFDVSVWELFWPLMVGSQLVMAAPGAHRDPAELARTIERHQITTLHFVPSMLQAFVDAGVLERCSSLRQVMSSGEALPAELASRVMESHPAELHNLYGPTEAAVDVTYWRCRSEPGAASTPIGRPISNTTIHLVDASLSRVPAGVAGELMIGGVALARGYHGRPSLTAERFIPDPFSELPGQRMYRTMDLARYRADGAIEYLGRLDHQVKIRGFRIELGEIEACLVDAPEVQAAAMLAREDGAGQKRLVAYVVPSVAGAGPTLIAELRERLARRLPEHMLPAQWLLLDALPLSPNGKLDRKALAALALDTARAEYEPPAGEVERGLAEIWQAVLGVARVGATDDFFELGGHSLLALSVLSRVTSAFGVQLPLRRLFERRRLRELAQEIAQARGGEARRRVALEPRPRKGRLPLSAAQRRLWFLWQLEPSSSAYNMPCAVTLRGRLDVAALSTALDALVERHEALRTRFAPGSGEPEQQIDPPGPLALVRVDLSTVSSGERSLALEHRLAAESQAPFDLQRGPLVRAVLFRLDEGEHVLLVTLHHIVSDGWSMNIIVDEFIHLYGSAASGERPALQPLEVQYADFAIWQKAWLEDGEEQRQLDYWRRALDGGPPILELPGDRPRPAQPSFRGSIHRFDVSETLSSRLRALGRQRGLTPFALLLGAFSLVASERTGQCAFRIGTDAANRNEPASERIVGFFVNQLVLDVSVSEAQPAGAWLAALYRRVLEAVDHQDLPFDTLVRALAPARRLGQSPFFGIKVIYQEQGERAPNPPGLDISPLPIGGHGAELDLVMAISATPAQLFADLSYATDLFDAATIEALAADIVVVLQRIADDPDVPVATLVEQVADARRSAARLESARATARAKDGALEAQKAVPLRRRARTEQRRE